MELMNHSEQIGDLAAALCAAQTEFSAIPKTGTNPFFNSKYAPLPAVVAEAQPILTKHGLAVTQLLGHDDGGDTLSTCLLHKSGQFIADSMRLRPVKDDPQAQGSATTYARRYSYMAILGLVADEDDDGNHATQAAPAGRVSQSGSPSEKQLDYLKSLVTREKPSEAVLRALLTRVGADGVDPTAAGWSKALNKAQVSQLIETFKNGVLPTGESDIPSHAPEFSRDPEIPEDDPSIPFDAVGAEHER